MSTRKPYVPTNYSSGKKTFKLLSFKNLVVIGALAWGSYYGVDKYYQITENTTLAQMGKDAASKYADEKKQEAKDAIKKKINENETTAKISTGVNDFLDKYNKFRGKDSNGNPVATNGNNGNNSPDKDSKDSKAIKDKAPATKEAEKIKDIQDEKSKPATPTPAAQIVLTVPFIYDHAGAPKGIDQKEALNIIASASKRWEEACGVKFNFVKTQSTDHISGANLLKLDHGLIRWEAYEGNTVGQAMNYNTREIHKPNDHYDYGHFSIGLDLNKIKTAKGMEETLVHEFGHVIGLQHSRFDTSVMFPTQFGQAQQLSEGDAQACKTIVENVKIKNKI